MDTSNATEDQKEQKRRERKLEESRALIKVLREAGYAPRSYSGRGMMGKSCVAVDKGSDNYSAFDDSLCLFRLGRDLAELRDLDTPHTDSMGVGIVAYWRSMPWPPDERDEDDLDEDDDSDDEDE